MLRKLAISVLGIFAVLGVLALIGLYTGESDYDTRLEGTIVLVTIEIVLLLTIGVVGTKLPANRESVAASTQTNGSVSHPALEAAGAVLDVAGVVFRLM